MERIWLNRYASEETTISDFVTMISTPEDWILYQDNINKLRTKRYTHFGIPVHFPCLVISIEESDEPIRYFEHRFIYPDSVRILLEKERIVNARFNQISNNIEDQEETFR